MIGIYKITNRITSLVYIGQSVNIYKRWTNHRASAFNANSKDYNIPLYQDMRKYGLQNFIFEIIEECDSKELNDREQYWIEYYDSFYNGYNESFGGTLHCRRSNVSKEKIIGVLTDLKTTNMKHKDIAQKWDISTEMVQGINTGRYWKHNISYPIQKEDHHKDKGCIDRKINEKVYKKDMCCPICGGKMSYDAEVCLECHLQRIHKNIPSKDVLESQIRDNSFVQLGKMYGVSDNAVRKWCKSYGLPFRKKDLESYFETN